MAELDINYPTWITAEELEKAIDRVYSSQFFERVTYRVEPSDKGTRLIVELVEKSEDLFRFGLRYDSDFKAALLLNASFRNRAEHGSALNFDLRLGEELQFDAEYFLHTGLRPRIGLRGRANYTKTTLDIFDAGRRTASLDLRTGVAEALLGTIFSNVMVAGIGIKAELADYSPKIAQNEFLDKQEKFVTLLGLLRIDTYDRAIFPRRGHAVHLTSEAGYGKIGRSPKFLRHSLDWQAVFSVHPKLSFLGRLQLGSAQKSGLPLHYHFFLGGVDSFVGLHRHELNGGHVQALQLGIQYEAMPRRFILLRWNIGNTFGRWSTTFSRQQYLTGIGLTLGASTLLGPLEFSVMHSSRNRLLTHINLGYKF
jgi:NTE family protein